jgi:hypothetical protein
MSAPALHDRASIIFGERILRIFRQMLPHISRVSLGESKGVRLLLDVQARILHVRLVEAIFLKAEIDFCSESCIVGTDRVA